jgi:hypothetical protein
MAPRSDVERPDGRVSRRAYSLLVFAALVWGGNAVASRMAVGQGVADGADQHYWSSFWGARQFRNDRQADPTHTGRQA